jgi:hypothetical protein
MKRTQTGNGRGHESSPRRGRVRPLPGLAAATAFVFAFCLAGLDAAAAATRRGPTLTVSNVHVQARWREGWFTGSVRFSATVSDPSELTAYVRPAKGGGVLAKMDYSIAQAGAVTETLPLPARPVPGTYRLRVFGKSGTTSLPQTQDDFVVPAPVEGLVDKGWISVAKAGRPTPNQSLKGPLREMWVRFHFLVPPTQHPKTVKIVWHTPSSPRGGYRVVGIATKPYAATIDSFVRSLTPAPLQRGKWYAILVVGGKIAKRAEKRIV